MAGSMFGQEIHDFHYRLEYDFFETETNRVEKNFIQHYLPANYSDKTPNSLVNLSYLSILGNYNYVFIDGKNAVTVTPLDLGNNFTIPDFTLWELNPVEKIYDEVELVKMNKSYQVLDRTCNFYHVKSQVIGNEVNDDFAICVDETHKIDNLSFIFPTQKGAPVKGLVLAISSPEEGMDKNIIKLSRIIENDIQIHFDKAEIDLAKTKYAAWKSADDDFSGYDEVEADDYDGYDFYSEYMEYPELCSKSKLYDLGLENESTLIFAENAILNICSYTYLFKRGEEDKFKKFAEAEIKSNLKNLTNSKLMSKKDSKLVRSYVEEEIKKIQKTDPAIPPVFLDYSEYPEEDVAIGIPYGYDSYEDFLEAYVSTYKTLNPEETDFAIQHLDEDSKLWTVLPAYCKKIDSIIPNFSNQEVKIHAKNYAGQICDMYLGEYAPSNVWYKGTLDGIRAEQNYFANKKDQLNNTDKKLLEEFLNSLD